MTLTELLAMNGLTSDDLKPNTAKDEKLNALLEVVEIDRVQSDKLGYDWDIIRVGDLEVRKTYVVQAHPVGTADAPIEWYDGVELINNAYYMKDGVRQVYMDGQWVEF